MSTPFGTLSRREGEYGAFPALPGRTLADAFLLHVKRTGQPETFPGITTSAPPDGARMEIVTHFRINPLQRPNGDMAPCPICSPARPKYLEGTLVWYPKEEAIRAIGHECGSGATREERQQADGRYKERLRGQRIVADLRVNLPEVEMLLARADRLTAPSEYATGLSRKLKREAKTFCWRLLDEVNRYGGELRFLEQIRNAKDELETVPHLVGIVDGPDFMRPMFLPDHHLIVAKAALQHAYKGGAADARAWIDANIVHTAELEDVHKSLMRGVKELEKVEGMTRDAAAFLATENLEAIGQWAYRGGVHGMRCQVTTTGVHFVGPAQGGTEQSCWLFVDLRRLQL